MAFLKIVLGSILFIFVVWYTLFFYGTHKKYIQYDHPVINKVNKTIFIDGLDNFNKYKDLSLKDGFKFGINVEIYVSSKNDFYAISKNLNLESNIKDWNQHSTEEIDALSLTLPEYKIFKLEKLFEKYPDQLILLNIRENIKDLDLILSAFIKKNNSFNIENRILINSDFDVVLSSLKAQLPRWVYGTGSGDRARFLMLSSIFLNGVYEVKGDFYITKLSKDNVKLLNKTLQADLNNRFLPLIIGPLETESETKEAISFNPTAFLTSNPKLLTSMLDTF